MDKKEAYKHLESLIEQVNAFGFFKKLDTLDFARKCLNVLVADDVAIVANDANKE